MSCSYGPTPSNVQYKTILLKNLLFCCQNAVDIEKFLNLLYNESIISKSEQQVADNYNFDAEKMEKLIEILLVKDYKYFPWLIKCLEESQNKYLANKLVSSYNELNGSYYPPTSPPTTIVGSQLKPFIRKSDFPVQSTKVLAIAKKLVEEHFVLDNWMLILEGFQLPAGHVHQIHNMIRGELHPQLYIQKTLQTWLSNKGCAATWSNLIEILTSGGCASGAILDRNRELYR